MAAQLLIYERAVPVSNARHGRWSADVGTDYSFSKSINSVPLTAVEFPHAAGEYPIVFTGTQDAVMPVVILGLRGQENLFLAQDNSWKATYIPAFVRRYPFVFSSNADNTQFTLCIDEAFPGFNQEGRGARLFDDQGKPSAYVDNVMKFLQEYQAQFQRTRAFCKKLSELKLLDPMQAQVTLPAGARTSLTGFMAVNRERLKQVAADKLAELAKTDELELIYLHLQSMRNFAGLKDRLALTEAGSSGKGAPTPAMSEGDHDEMHEKPKAASGKSARRV